MDISGWINDFFGQLGNLLSVLVGFALSGLPDSPFVMLQRNSDVLRILGYVNYVIPVSFALATLQLWLVAVGVFYVWQLLLRWIKAIN